MMKSFNDWMLDQNESTATTRARKAAAKGLLPWNGTTASGSHNTPSPTEWKAAVKATHKKLKKK